MKIFLVTSVLIGVTAVASADWITEVGNDNPLNWYQFNEAAAGDVATDHGSGGQNGAYSSGSGMGVNAPRGAGQAVNFSGDDILDFTVDTTGAATSVANNATLTGDYTAEYILRRTGTGMRALHSSNYGNLRLSMSGGDMLGYTQYGVADNRFSSAAVAPTTRWAHIVYVRDAAANTMSIYIDGQLVDTKNGAMDLGNSWFGQGRDKAGDSLTALVDEAVVYDRKLDASEIQTHYDHSGLMNTWNGDGRWRDETANWSNSIVATAPRLSGQSVVINSGTVTYNSNNGGDMNIDHADFTVKNGAAYTQTDAHWFRVNGDVAFTVESGGTFGGAGYILISGARNQFILNGTLNSTLRINSTDSDFIINSGTVNVTEANDWDHRNNHYFIANGATMNVTGNFVAWRAPTGGRDALRVEGNMNVNGNLIIDDNNTFRMVDGAAITSTGLFELVNNTTSVIEGGVLKANGMKFRHSNDLFSFAGGRIELDKAAFADVIAYEDGVTSFIDFVQNGSGDYLAVLFVDNASLADVQSLVAAGHLGVDGTATTSLSNFSYTANGAGFDVTVAPEPTTIGLLAMGGLAMLRRRKRS